MLTTIHYDYVDDNRHDTTAHYSRHDVSLAMLLNFSADWIWTDTTEPLPIGHHYVSMISFCLWPGCGVLKMNAYTYTDTSKYIIDRIIRIPREK